MGSSGLDQFLCHLLLSTDKKSSDMLAYSICGCYIPLQDAILGILETSM